MRRAIRAVVTDDESSGRDSIRVLLAQHPEIDTVAECVTGPETVRVLAELQPDLLFLDVQLPGRTGVEILEQVPQEVMPVVIFVTAYEDYAVRAFDAHAADYLLKPYSDARFNLALERAKQRLEQRSFERLRRGILALAEQASVTPRESARRSTGWVERLTIPTEAGLRIVPVEEIGWIEAAGDYVCVHTRGKALVLRSTMGSLERKLDPATFVRIHRSTLVNVSFVVELKGSPSSDYVAVLKDGTGRAISGRGREQLARALDVRM